MAGGRTANHRRSIATAGNHAAGADCRRVLVLTGALFGTFVAPAFFGLSAFVGAGLMFAGMVEWCGMANLLRAMP